ncbi:MAG TPA: hypothetical protein VIV60_33225, partial [Polyangiaceae bacterium]
MSNSREPQYSEPPEFDAAFGESADASKAEPRRSEGPAQSDLRPPPEPGAEAFASDSPEPRDLGPLDGTTDSMLSRYFRDMATHQVMGPDEELECAQAVEEAEIEHWVALLSYVPVAESIVDRLEKDIGEASEADRPEVPQVEELRNQVKIYRKQRSKLNAEQQRQWNDLSADLARVVRLPDSDRIWMTNALRVAKEVVQPESGDTERPPVADTPAYRRYMERVRRTDYRQRC